MSETFSVKGSSIRSKLDFVRERFGPDSERELKQALAPERDLSTVLDSSLYPFDLYNRLLTELADRHYAGDLSGLQKVGEYSAEKALTTVYRAFAQGKDFLGFLDRIQLLHSRFYNQGTMAVTVNESRKGARILLEGAPVYTEADLNVAAGFYLGAARLLGLENPTCRRDVTNHSATFHLAWD